MESQVAFLAGMLEAEGSPPGTASDDQLALTLAEIARGPTLWRSLQPQKLDDYTRRVTRHIARWRPPTGVVPVNPYVTAFLEEAKDKDVRVEVASTADWATAMSTLRRHGRVSAYVRRPATDDWHWRWPLRLGVLASTSSARLVAEANASSRFAELYAAFETDGSQECEILFITPDRIGETFRSAAIVVVLDAAAEQFAPDLLESTNDLGAAGVAFCPDASLAWVEDFVIALSHDAPVDLALAAAAPGAMLAADPEFVARITVRQWGMALSRSLRDTDNPALADRLDALLGGAFDSERRETTATIQASRQAHMFGIDAEITGGPPRVGERDLELALGEGESFAPPADDVDLPAPADDYADSPAMAGDGEPPTQGAEPPTAGAEPPALGEEPTPGAPQPDKRYLQAMVRAGATPSGKRKVTQRFVPGAMHDLRVRIAAQTVVGAIAARAPFRSPEPGRTVKLDVSIIVGTERTRRSLTLPGRADSRWTSPVHFEVPADAVDFAVYVEVAYRKRVIQSAMLTGDPFELSVDMSEPAETVRQRKGARGRITLVDGSGDSPTLLDLDVDAGNVNQAQIAEATADLRKELLAAFLEPPASLEQAAEPLTRLAIRGRILYERLAGPAGTYHDADPWIHVNAFSKYDVPIELIYTHPMPADDTMVPVCPEALAGATRCTDRCAHRNDANVVCPFGFWATSKIIERRRHVHDRSSGTPGLDRRVAPTRSCVVGVTVKADEVDGTSSARIIAAIRAATPGALVVKSWQELDDAAAGHPALVVLVTHTVEPQAGGALDRALELNGDVRRIYRIGDAAINPGRREPGPVVFALGCDTNKLTAGYTDLVVTLHNARAEVVLSALSPIPGKGVADFLERFMPLLTQSIATDGSHRFGPVMLAARRATMQRGDIMALALSVTGDAEVELTS